MVKKSNDYAILHKKIRYDKNISSSAKILFGEIESLCFKEGFCWATNKYFANLYQVSTRTVERWIENLVTHGYIARNICFYPNSKQVKQRVLKINLEGTNIDKTKIANPLGDKNVSTPPDNSDRSLLTKICVDPLTKVSDRIYKYINKKKKSKDISLKKTKKNTPETAKTLSQRDLIEEFHKKGI